MRRGDGVRGGGPGGKGAEMINGRTPRARRGGCVRGGRGGGGGADSGRRME